MCDSSKQERERITVKPELNFVLDCVLVYNLQDQTMEILQPYILNLPYCGICLKTKVEAELRANKYHDIFANMQISPAPQWLCSWCHRRLTTFNQLKCKAHKALHLLNTVRNVCDRQNSTIDLQNEINNLKREHLLQKTVDIQICLAEPEYIEVKTEGDVTLGQRREGQHDDVVEVKTDAYSDDETLNVMPLYCSDDEENAGAEDIPDCIDNAESCHNINKVEELPQKLRKSKRKKELKNNSWSAKRETRIEKVLPKMNFEAQSNLKSAPSASQISSTQPNPQAEDIIAAIEDLDNESFIVSEEVSQHVETITSDEAEEEERKRRLSKSSYINAVVRCARCLLGFQTAEDYEEHMRHHSPSAGPHSCQTCDVHYATHRQLERHVQTHGARRRLRCRLCGRASADRRAAVRHHIAQHSTVRFTCWLCNKDFRRPINLKKHLQREHPGEARAAGCAVCAQEFEREDLLRRHILSHKPSEITWHECTICKKKSRNAYHMRQHERTHEQESLPIVCDICMKTFKTRLLLETHMQRLHTDNNKKYQCDECGKFFYDKGELRIHVQWTHNREGGVECTQCNRKFRTAYLLKDHTQRLHNNIPKPKDKLCDICGRGFSCRKTLQSHRYIHTGERPHHCPDCGQAFRQRCAMRLHYKSKHLHIAWRDLVGKKLT